MIFGFWKRLCCVGLLCAASIGFSAVSGSPEALPIRQLTFEVVGESEGNGTSVLSSLQTKEHERFSQGEFDKDLKQLARDFDRVEPTVTVEGGEVAIALKVWKKPMIHDISWKGIETVDKDKIVKEFGIASGSVFDRQGFSKAIQKLRQYLVRKGFFEAEIDYKIIPQAVPNTIDIEITIKEGRAGYVDEITFDGLTSGEIDEISDLIMTKEYCFWLSWLNNQGTFYKDVFRQDEMTILRYLQNKGFLDAKVGTEIKPSPNQKDRIVISITAEKGDIYKLGNITTSDNILFTQEALLKAAGCKASDVYSPDGIRMASKAMSNLYGSKGYIDAAAIPEPKLRDNERVYDVDFKIEEGKQFRVGMIEIIGNTVTEPRVILHENLLVPGAVFDTNLLAKTEERLRNIGYFKTVNVYAVKSSRVEAGGAAFRDVHIEVEEVSTTAQFTAFAGWNSDEGISGGIGVSESNFRFLGLKNLFSDGFRALRGGGEYASANVTIGTKQLSYNASWTKPYFLDTKWTVGIDLQKMRNSYSAKDYTIKSDEATFTGKRELNSFVKFGTHYRIKDADIDLHGIHHSRRNKELIRESKNGGVISAAGVALYYDSSNHPVTPREGVRSELSAEYAGIGGDHHFLRLGYLNSLFYPLTEKGTLRLRGDVEAIQTLFGSKPKNIPLDERYYLGGDSKMRGFRYNSVGPKFHDKDHTPRGGMSLLYLSSEYEHPLYKRLSAFVFVDGGNVWWEEFVIKRLQCTAGFGLKVYIAEGTPLTFGMGYPIQVERKNRRDVRHFFFSIGVGF